MPKSKFVIEIEYTDNTTAEDIADSLTKLIADEIEYGVDSEFACITEVSDVFVVEEED